MIATNRIFDEVWSRVYKGHKAKLLAIVPKGQCPLWLDQESCIEVPYNYKGLSRLTACRQLSLLLESLPSSIVINDFLPIPFGGLAKHTHIQFICHIYSKSESLIRHLGVINQISKIKESSYILTISETSKSELIKLSNLSPEHIIVSYCGISKPLLNNKKLSPEGEKYDLLYIATFIYRKNHLNLIKALSLLNQPVKLALLGQDFGYKNKVVALTRQLGLQESVDFLELMPESEMADLYCRSRVFVSPSIREGFGMPVAEALATGLPVACSDIPVFREVAGSWARYFNPHNPADIARKLKSLLDAPDTLVTQVKAGQHYAREKFSWDGIAEQLIDKLADL